MVELLLLDSGCDIPFEEAQLVLHPPSIKEISMFGEEKHLIACDLLTFTKAKYTNMNKELEQYSDFDIIMSVLTSTDEGNKKVREAALEMLSFLFKGSEIVIQGSFLLVKDENGLHLINPDNLPILQDIIKDIFCMRNSETKDFNPAGDLAKQIADKIKEGRKKRAELARKRNGGVERSFNRFSPYQRYVSILSAGMNIDKNIIYNYTVFQLMDSYNRFALKESNDQYFMMRIAGGSGIDAPEPWQKDIYDETENHKILDTKSTALTIA